MAFVDDYNPINFVDLPSETTPPLMLKILIRWIVKLKN